MSTWTERAKAHFSQKAPNRTDETDETPISSVLSVGVEPVSEKAHGGFVGFVGTDVPLSGKSEGSTSARWLIHFADGAPLEVVFAPPAEHSQVLADYPEAVAAEPLQEQEHGEVTL